MKSGRILDFMLRGSIGLVCICMCNLLLEACEYTIYAAINLVSFLLCSVLGLPGVIITLFITVIRGMGV